MAEVLAGAAAEFVLGQAFDGAKYFFSVAFSFNSFCERYKKYLNESKPIFDEICELNKESQLQILHLFKGKVDEALLVVEECEQTSSLNLCERFYYARRLKAVDKEIYSFHRRLLPLTNTLINLKVRHQISVIQTVQEERQISSFSVDEERQISSFSGHVVGFDKFLVDLKELLLHADVNVVGLTGMSGMGKSTLASALYHDHQIKGYFKKRVIYITVSETPNLEDILGIMWDKIIGRPRPHFQNEEDAHNQLQAEISSKEKQQTLVVLDDVRSRSDLEILLFEGKEYKTLVTTRDDSIIPTELGARYKQYPLPFMQEEDALSLFRLCAFGHDFIPSTHDEELVKQVLAKCEGLPLALKVIGNSLYGQPYAEWKRANNKLSRGEAISKYHEKALFGRLKTSIDVLDDQEMQCFLTLGAFPKRRNICVNALLDIWVYVRGMEWEDAFVLLLGFAGRSLLELKGDLRRSVISYDCPYDLSFSQHEVMRDLALHLAMQDKKILWTPQTARHQPCRAQIVSIPTGVTDLSEMKFLEAEALLLIFTASEYPIPTFLSTMKKLKVLMIHNYGSKRFKLNELDAFLPLSQLKALRLEKLIVPSLFGCYKALENLEKLSLTLCEGLGNMSGPGWCQCFTSPKLSEINLDYCSDLEELPTEICNMNFLRKLSVTNCHQLCELPHDLGKLSSLQVLRLCACVNLKALPRSICKLGHLEFLDISGCSSLEGFPDGFDELGCLKKLDMRECSRLKHNFHTLSKLPSLKLVVCDSGTKQPTSIAEQVHVEVVDKPESLDWLNDR